MLLTIPSQLTVGLRCTLFLASPDHLFVTPESRPELGAPDAPVQLCYALERLRRDIIGSRIKGRRQYLLADFYGLREVINPNRPNVWQLVLWLNVDTIERQQLLKHSNNMNTDAMYWRAHLKNLLFDACDDQETYALGCMDAKVVIPERAPSILMRQRAFLADCSNCGFTPERGENLGTAMDRATLKAFALANSKLHRQTPPSNVTVIRRH